ncbi:MAG: lipoate--protein ligase family protein [Coriobacteriales bacterium]|nr:lipoate--protein ligase family protein [Coriobacteriales bacterium]
METWRLLAPQPHDGAVNMAIDRAVLHAHAQGEAPTTLRLYRWNRPTVSLGRFQDVGGVDLEWCVGSGIDVVRRPTGGRGVLHDDELTYSIVAGVREGLPKSISGSYRRLCTALVAAYRRLGVEASLTPRASASAASPACYLHATDADLSLGVAKLSGSAQVWERESVLQHGSFVVTRDIEREARAFRLDQAEAERLSADTVTISEALGRRPSADELVDAVVSGLAEGLGVTLEPGSLMAGEREMAVRFAEEAHIGGVAPAAGPPVDDVTPSI